MAGAQVDVLATGGVSARGVRDRRGTRRRVVDGQHGILLPGSSTRNASRQDVWGLRWARAEAGPSVLDRIDNERRLRRELGLAHDVQAEGLARQR